MASIEAGNLFSVKDQVIVVTGGGSGLGEIMAQALDINGASKVFILGRREEYLKRVASEAKNGSIIPVVLDVTSKDSIAAAAAEVASQTPFVNVVIANSGIAGPADAFGGNFTSSPPSLEELKAHLWSTSQNDVSGTFNVNTVGSYFTFIAFLSLLEAGNTHADSPGKSGYIQSQFITNSSLAGLSRANIVGYPYAASKAALIHLTKMLATEFAPYGIRANSIAPGLFITEPTKAMVPEGVPVETPGVLPKEVNPALRVGGKEDLAGVILFLISRAGGFANGNVILVDGGATSIRPASF